MITGAIGGDVVVGEEVVEVGAAPEGLVVVV